jgi:hypothetical protein
MTTALALKSTGCGFGICSSRCITTFGGDLSAAPKTLKPAEALCAAQGRFFHPPTQANEIYGCEENERVLSENQERTARVLCERAYRGTFQPEGGPTREYFCLTPT